MAAAHLSGKPMISALKWLGDKNAVTFHVVNRITGEKENDIVYRSIIKMIIC